MATNNTVLYQRKLSGIERYSLVINEVYRYNVDGVVEGTGTFDPHSLRRAIATAAQANPGVRVRLRSLLGFSKWVDSGIDPELTIVAAPQWDGRSERGADFLQKRFDALGGGPIADIILVTGAAKTRIIFRGLHAAIDGRSIMHWMQEVFRALRNEPLIGGLSTLTDSDVAARYRDKLTPTDAKANGPKKLAASAEMPALDYIPVVPPSALRDAELGYLWRAITIPKKINNILPRAAIFLAQYARRNGTGPVGFTVPVDYRGLRVEANSTGNLTGYLRIHVGSYDTPKTVMQQINRQIRAYVDCKMPLLVAPLRWIPVRYMAKKLQKNMAALLYTPNKNLVSGGLVSMGQTHQSQYSCADFKAERVFGIPGAVGKLNVLAVNLPDSTIVTFSAALNYNRDGQIDRLAEEFAEAFSA